MDFITALRNDMVGLKAESVLSIQQLAPEYEAWLIHTDNKIGVGIPCSREEAFYEKFSSVCLAYLPAVLISNEKKSVLWLYMNRKDVSNRVLREFATICGNFVMPGEEGTARKRILENPLDWWQSWKEIIGNRKGELQVHSVIGELMVWYYLLKQRKKAEWTGNKRTRVDFVVNDSTSVEVKSTLNRYSSEVTVHGQFQLLLNEKVPLQLVFCRMEENGHGFSIDDMKKILLQAGVEADVLERELEEMGFVSGSSNRRRKFTLIEMRKYMVDENFPRITPEQFRTGKIPAGVIRIEYTIDLANIVYKQLDPGVFAGDC